MQNPPIPIKDTSGKTVLPPLTEVVYKGAKIRIYINERPNATTTAYTAGVATGQFTKDGKPVVEPISPTLHVSYDFYLADTKVSFLRLPSDKNVIERRANRAGAAMDMHKMRAKH